MESCESGVLLQREFCTIGKGGVFVCMRRAIR